MNKSEVKKELPSIPEEQEIDLIELVQKVWSERIFILKCCGVASIIGLIVAFSIPREYSTNVTLAPESNYKSPSSGMGALASMAGVNLRGGSTEDALSPELYPDIVKSTPFLIELFNIKVEDIKNTYQTTLFDYLDSHQRSTWWSKLMSAPFNALGWVISLFKDTDEEGEGVTNPFKLTLDETRIASALSNRISVSVDKKTGMTNLAVIMQDPLISATVTDTVMVKLQNYITNYRTNKARQDLIFTEKLYLEAKENYYEAQQTYAEYVDENQNVIRQSSRTEQERLQNEMSLAYGVYNQVAQQLQIAKAKVQEITPVYTVVQPATVPLRPSKPSKLLILIGFVFLAGIGSVGWVLFIRDFSKIWKKEKEA